jgi:hypothetical protein
MKPIAADLPHLDRHLPVARFNAAGLGNDYQSACSRRAAWCPTGFLPAPAVGNKINRPDFILCIVITLTLIRITGRPGPTLPCLMKKLLTLKVASALAVPAVAAAVA